MNKYKPSVILDLDDTLINFREPMCQLLNKLTDKGIHWKEWNCYGVGDFYDMTGEEFCEYIVEHEILQNLEPHEETRGLLTELHNRNYNIVIISARGFHPNADKVTRDWFAKYDLPLDELYISTHGNRKIDSVKEHENIILTLDDNVQHCEDFIASGKPQHVLLYDMPWNIESSIPRIKSLNEVYNYI